MIAVARPMRNAMVLAMALMVVACSKPNSGAIESASLQVASPQSASAQKPKACNLVTAAEVSAIVGSDVAATSDDTSSVNVTKCAYQPVSGSSMPMIELTVEWGMAEAAMVANSMMRRMENGELNDPLAGVGDQAFVIGPEAMIRHGDDLVRIMIYGTEDSMAATKRMFELTASRLP